MWQILERAQSLTLCLEVFANMVKNLHGLEVLCFCFVFSLLSCGLTAFLRHSLTHFFNLSPFFGSVDWILQNISTPCRALLQGFTYIADLRMALWNGHRTIEIPWCQGSPCYIKSPPFHLYLPEIHMGHGLYYNCELTRWKKRHTKINATYSGNDNYYNW